MKIAIVWSHWVGKTTLSKKISQKLNLDIIEDIVPIAHNMWFTINEETPIETQLRLAAKQLELERQYKGFITDKCLIDYYIYGKVLIDDQDLIRVLDKISSRNAKYDYMFYLPIEFDIVDDGLRPLDPEFQKNIDIEYKQFLDKENIDYHTITGSVEEREEQLMQIIQNNI